MINTYITCNSAKNIIFCLLLLVVQGDGKGGAVAADSMEAASQAATEEGEGVVVAVLPARPDPP